MKGGINYTNHLTNKYYDSQGREIAVFDNVLSQGDLSRLREYLVHDYSTFGFQPYDDERKEDHDNVAWISVQKVYYTQEMYKCAISKQIIVTCYY